MKPPVFMEDKKVFFVAHLNDPMTPMATLRKISKLLSLTAPLEEVSDRQRRLDVPLIEDS